MNKETIKTIIITILAIILTGLIGYHFGSQWFQNRLTQERNIATLQIQNEIYNMVKSRGIVTINYYEVKEGEIQITDNIILVESNGK